jgi:capsular polysaccharide transport system ATP-binding protein
MIEIKHVTKSYRTNRGREFIFRDLNLVIPDGKNIALIGRNGAGKSTLMRLIGGLDIPDKGLIRSTNSISWPVGLGGGFQGSLTARDNVKFIARVHGMEGEQVKDIVRYVEEFAEIGRYFDLPVKTYSSGMRSRVAFGLSLAFDFDYYLIDEGMSTGDAHFQNKAQAAFKNRISGSKVILVTHSMGQVRKMCDFVLLMRDGQVFPYEDVEEGIQAYQSLANSPPVQRELDNVNKEINVRSTFVRKWNKLRNNPRFN